MHLQPEILDTVQVATLLGCSERTIPELRKRPGFPAPVALFGVNRPRWRREDLLAWMRGLPALEAAPAPSRLARGKAEKRAARLAANAEVAP
jgi:predicted DNA-binding transcriptional regulator AlpA